MNRVEHEFTAEQWVDLLDGTLERIDTARMRAHVDGCEPCRRTYQDLSLSRSRLEQLRSRLDAVSSRDATARVRQSVLARIRITQAASVGEAMSAGVDQLRSILQPLCGGATTERALRSAALHCRVAGAEQIGRQQWEPFVGQLGAIVEAMCGASVAQWIQATARGIQWEAGC